MSQSLYLTPIPCIVAVVLMDIYKHITESLTLSAKLNYSLLKKKKRGRRKKKAVCVSWQHF